MNQSPSQETKDLLSKYNLQLKKSLGQNLMIDKAVLERIIEAAELLKDDTVIEIGTGTGLLSKELAKAAKKVITFEVDKRILEVAKEYLADCNNVEIVNEDFLKADLNTILSDYTLYSLPNTLKAVANIPYYITSPIIEKIIENRKNLSLAVLTVQREFGERMTAVPGTKAYGSFSIFVNFYCEPEIVSLIPKSSFLPQPDIGSAIIRLKFRTTPAVKVKSEKTFFDSVHAAFGQRRKTLRKALSAKFDRNKVEKSLEISGIDPKRRGETLSLDEFAHLSDLLHNFRN